MILPLPLIIAIYVLFPALAIYLCLKVPFLNKIGIVVVCYIVGLTFGNLGIMPAGISQYQDLLSNIAVVLGLPLLLFSFDIQKWLKLTGKALLAMLFAIIAIILVAFIGYLVIKGKTQYPWQLAGMAIGVYTGGTPNLIAIKTAFNVDINTFVIFHTYDTIISLIYILFVVTIAQRLFNKFLPAFNQGRGPNPDLALDHAKLQTEGIDAYQGIFTLKTLLPLSGALLISMLIAGIGYLITRLVPSGFSAPLAILTITTLGIGGSFILRIRKIDKTFQAGMYIIYIFCFVLGSMANVRLLVNIDYILLFFVLFSIFGSMAVHALLCRWFKIDTDTFLVVSVSAICSPPFVPPVATALKNKELLPLGIITGIIGYAVGNYLGIFFGQLFRLI